MGFIIEGGWRTHREIWQETNGTLVSTYAFRSSQTAQTANLGNLAERMSSRIQRQEKTHCKSSHLLECKMKHVWNIHHKKKKTRVFCDLYISLRSNMLRPAVDPLLNQQLWYSSCITNHYTRVFLPLPETVGFNVSKAESIWNIWVWLNMRSQKKSLRSFQVDVLKFNLTSFHLWYHVQFISSLQSSCFSLKRSFI